MSKSPAIIQMAWVVNDLREAATHWTTTTGIGPFLIVEGIVIEDQTYRGEPTDLQVSYALAQAGEVQIELVAQQNEVPSVYRDSFASGEEGFHHVAFYPADYDGELARYVAQGFEIGYRGCFDGKRFCYIDTRATLGHMVEIIEHSAAQDKFFAQLRSAAADWDGRDSLRSAF